jgi:hypothetical protein
MKQMPQRLIRPATAFSLDGGALRKRPRAHARDHLKFIRGLPCLISGTRKDVDAAHIRYADHRFGKRNTGGSEKPDDKWVVPLQRALHEQQHGGNERAFWQSFGIDPVAVAAALWAASGDEEAGEVVIEQARKDSLAYLATLPPRCGQEREG